MQARRDTVIENYHGIPVADPYRWMEEMTSPEVKAWVDEQNQVTHAYLDATHLRPTIKARLTELWDYPKYSGMQKIGNRYFYFKNNGLQNQPVFYRQERLDADPVVVLDPNRLSDDGTVALTNLSFAQDGKLLAYATSQSGSDWQEIRVRDVNAGQDYPDLIQWCKFRHIAWTPDSQGFFYSRYPEAGSVPKEDASNFNKVYYHRLGTEQVEDQLIYESPDNKELGFSPYVTDDGQYLYLIVSHGTDHRNRFYYRPLGTDQPFVKLLDDFDAAYQPVGTIGSRFYFETDYQAPHSRIIAIDLERPERSHWQEIVAESEDVIAFAGMVHDHFLVVYLHHAHHQVKLFDLQGHFIKEIGLPTIGAVVGMSGKRQDDETFLSFTSYLYPATVFRYDFTTGLLSQVFEAGLTFNPDDYQTSQVFYPSKDGTRVPMFLTHKKGLQLNGANPTLLTGYGGFNIASTPSFSADRLVWLENGGVFAVACMRGGNEYGDAWHKGGMLANKQNVFDDFIAAGEWLIAKGYTTQAKLAITGRSNGGLLVAACMLQRPDLYGAVVCGVPVIDMLRYQRFTAGRYWTGEYGNAETNPEHFRFMMDYSPLHNVKQHTVYPPIIVLTADTDDRVVPMHSFKFTATLQAAAAPGHEPIILRVETKAGHGAGKPISKLIEEETDTYAFLFKELGVGNK